MDSVLSLLHGIPPRLQLLLIGVGAIYTYSKLLASARFFLDTWILSGTNLRKYGGKGTWAVITGASDGLGKEFAAQLAAKGFNLVLVSRTQAKLDALAQELSGKHAALQTKILAMDFSHDNDADYQNLAELVASLDLGILINNVGQSHSIPVPFLETSSDELQSIVTINCLGTLKTTQVVAPLLAKRKGRSLILTMGSFAGWMPTPYLATYSGSKAFLQYWSTSLAAELAPQGVDVQLVTSYLVTTAMSKVRRTSMLIPGPRPFVKAALTKIGRGAGQKIAHTYTPWWSHAVMQWVVENTIGSGSALAIWYNLEMHQDIRTRALRKAQWQAKKE